MHPIVIKDGEITFSTSTFVQNDVVVTLDPMDLVTEFGYMIPYHSTAWNIVDYLRYPQEKTAYRGVNSITIECFFITDKGQIMHVEATQSGKGITLEINLIPHVPSMYVVFGMQHESIQTMRLAINITDTIPEALDKYMSSIDVKQSKFYTWKLDDLIQYLKENKPSIPLLTNFQEIEKVKIPRFEPYLKRKFQL